MINYDVLLRAAIEKNIFGIAPSSAKEASEREEIIDFISQYITFHGKPDVRDYNSIITKIADQSYSVKILDENNMYKTIHFNFRPAGEYHPEFVSGSEILGSIIAKFNKESGTLSFLDIVKEDEKSGGVYTTATSLGHRTEFYSAEDLKAKAAGFGTAVTPDDALEVLKENVVGHIAVSAFKAQADMVNKHFNSYTR